LAGRWLAGAICDLLTASPGTAGFIDCPSLRRVLHMAKAEWA